MLETTDAWLAFSVRSIDATDADPFKRKRTVLDLLRLRVPPADVRRVVYENPCELLGLEP